MLASLGVLVGLLLVAYEIRRNNTLAEAQAVVSTQDGWEAISISEYETDISTLRAKSISDPENLTQEEIYKLNGWLTAVVTQVDRIVEMNERGLSLGPEITDDVEFQLEDNFSYYLDNRFGRAWYAENRNWMDPQITDVWDRQLALPLDSDNGDYAGRILERIRNDQ